MKNIVKPESLKKQDAREAARKELKKTFEDRYETNTQSTEGSTTANVPSIWRVADAVAAPVVLRISFASFLQAHPHPSLPILDASAVRCISASLDWCLLPRAALLVVAAAGRP